MSKDNVEDVTDSHDDMKHCKDCHYYERPKCKHQHYRYEKEKESANPESGKRKMDIFLHSAFHLNLSFRQLIPLCFFL